MMDVGDDYTIETTITVDGAAQDPSTVSLAITSPSGVESTVIPTNGGVGIRSYVVNLSEAGRWRWKWTTTGPAGVHHGSIVASDGPTLDPLCSVADIDLGRALTDAEMEAAPGLIASASASVRAACDGRAITQVVDDVVDLSPTHDLIRLPNWPVSAITSVAPLDDRGDPAGGTFEAWQWVRSRDMIKLRAFPSYDYRVTYSHGYLIVPDLIVRITAGAVGRVLSAPAGAIEGTTQTTIGQFSQQFQQSTGSPGRVPRLTRSDYAELERSGWRSMAGTIQTVVG